MTASSDSAIVDDARVLVVIVNYKTPHLVVDCLESLAPELRALPHMRVTVVDNPSGDDSVDTIRRAIVERGYGAWATVLKSPTNGGFAFGNNYVVRPALARPDAPEFFWLLNPDTLVRPGALVELVQFLRAHPQAGIAGSAIENEDGSAWPFAFRFPSFLSEFDQGLRLGVVSKWLGEHTVTRRMSDQNERVDWVAGASMIVRREVFDTIGLMDEDYFLYYEETDFCLRAARAGLECWYVPASRVMHIAGQSTGVTSKQDVPRRLPDYWFESRVRYFVKNHGRLYGMATDLAHSLGYASWRARRRLQRKPDADPPNYLFDFLRNSTLGTTHLPQNSRLAGRRAVR